MSSGSFETFALNFVDNFARFVKLIEKKVSINVENVSRSFRSRENSLCFVCSREEGKEGKKERKEKILCRVDKNIKEGSLHSWMDRDRAFHRHLSWSTPSIILANFLGVIQAGPRKLPSLNHTILVVEIISCGKKG